MEGQLFAHEVLAVVLRVRDRRLDCLLWQRAKAPFDGQWSLPRGPLGATERLGASASRHLAAKVDITSIAHMEQLETRSDPLSLFHGGQLRGGRQRAHEAGEGPAPA